MAYLGEFIPLNMLPDEIKTVVEDIISSPLEIENSLLGCVVQGTIVSSPARKVFVKWGGVEYQKSLKAEEFGLNFLGIHSPFSVPKIHRCGVNEEYSFLIMDYIKPGPPNFHFWEKVATNLATQHMVTQQHYGFYSSNFIGRLSQQNSLRENWYKFFNQERLIPQLTLAENKIPSKIMDGFWNFMNNIENLIPVGSPALLHGDLWSGNLLCDSDSIPVLIDPAVHYGHRETEIAFTKLFSGFHDKFYSVYNEEYPLEKGWEDRVKYHNLYPLLVHLNSFGNSYLKQIEEIITPFCRA